MANKLLTGLSSLLLPLGLYGPPAQSSMGYQRTYLQASMSALSASINHAELGSARNMAAANILRDSVIVTAEELNIASASPVKELVIIDAAVPDKQVFYRGVKPGVDIVEIDSSASGLTQLTAILAGYKNLTALHIVSHAEDGVLHLGSSRVDAAMLKQEVETFAALQGALVEGADLLLYGCDLASSEKGEELLEIIRSNTHLDVAASTNKTGNAEQGGDWELEMQQGEITSALAFSEKSLRDFSAVLAPMVYRSTNFCPGAGNAGGNNRYCASNTLTSVDGKLILGSSTPRIYAISNNYYVARPEFGTAIVPDYSYPYNTSGHIEFTANTPNLEAFTFTSLTKLNNFDGTCSSASLIGTRKSDGASVTDSITWSNNGATFTPTLLAGVALTKLRIQVSCNHDLSYALRLHELVIEEALSNNAPTATNLTQNLSFTEDPGNSVAINDIVVTDADAGDTITARFSLSNPAAGTLTTGTFGSATSTYNAGLGVWTVEGSVTDVNAALAAVAFNPATNWDQNFTITTRIRDSASTGPADGLISFTVTPVNDAPTATNRTQAVNFTEDPANPVDLNNIVVTDPDTGDTITATLTLSDASAGSLTTGTFGAATSTYNAGTGVWSVSGSVANVNAALAAVAFIPVADWDQNITIATRIRDAAGTGPADGAISLNVTPINDSPTGITLSANSILQSAALAGVTVGTLSSTDIDSSSFTYSLINAATAVAGTCAADTGNGSFQINGDVLETAAALAAGAYNLCIQTSDGAEGFKKGFTITVTDDIDPEISSVSVPADAWYIAGQTLIFTVNTTEDVTVTGLPTLPLTIGLADLTASYAAGSGTTELTFSYTIQAGDNDSDGITLGGAINSGGGTLRDAAGNNLWVILNAVGSTTGVLVDTNAPTVQSLTPASGSATVDPDANFVMTFSENIKLGTTGSIVIYDALNNPVSTIDVTSHAGQLSIANNVLTVNPTADLTENSSYYIQITSGAITDMAGLAYSGIADSTSWNFTVADLSPPAVTGITVSGTPAANAATMQFTVAFDEPVSGVSADDFVLTTTSGNASGSISSVSGAESSYTVTVESIGGSGGLRLDLNANTNIVDSQGNGNGTNGYVPTFTSGASHTVDRVAPVAPSKPVLNAASDSGSSSNDGITNVTTPTITGTAEVDSTVTLFGTDGITVLGTETADGSGNWSITISNPLAAGDHSLTVRATDTAGNESSASEALTIQIDTTAPTVSPLQMADTALIAGETSLVTFTFSEAVTDFTDALTASNGTLSELSSADGGITWTATFTPAINTTALINTISVAGASVTDIAGNAASGTTATTNYTIDTLRPAATIVVTDTELNLGETTAVTITFNRAVSGFTNDDVAFSNGTMTAFASMDGGITWSATFTPATNTDAPVNVITLDNSGVQDSAGNTGTGTTDSNVFAVHTVPRTLVVTSLLDTGDDGSIGNSLADDESDGNGLSLREALNWGRNGDTITFDQGGDIVLNGSPLIVKSSVVINGDVNNDGAADITVSGNNASRVMRVNNNVKGVDIKGLTLTQGNSVGGGAGLYLESGADVIMRNSNLTNNTETSNGGGAVYGSGVSFTMIDSTVSGNTSVAFGGALRIIGGNGTFLNLINTTLTGNSTTSAGQHGGAIQFGGQTLTVINSTISGNAALGATSMGGGLRVTSGNSYVYNSTIVGNAAVGGAGGVHANGIDTFVNTVIAGNTSGADATAATGGSPLATGGIADDVGSTIEVATNNYFGTQATISAGNDNNNLNDQGTTQLLLGNLATHNGSHNLTHRPLVGSALVDAGSTAALPPDTYDLNNNGDITEALPSDANGNARAHSVVDIGAVEGNSKPVISGTPATSVNENAAYSFMPTAVDAEGETLTFSITNKPDWAVFSSSTGGLSGTPTLADIGVVSGIVISVSDGNSSVSLPAFDVEVVNVNDAPTISGTPATSVNQDALYSFTPIASDIDIGDTLTFTITNRPDWASFNPATGALTGTPTNANVGVTTGIVISVSDSALTNSLPAFNLTVVNVNDAPMISGIPATSVNQDAPYSFTPIAADIDAGDTLTFTITNRPDWASFNPATGALTGTPTNANVGVTTGIVISVSDSALTTSLPAFNLTVVNVNDAPVISGSPGLVSYVGAVYDFTPTARDDDGDILTFSAVGLPNWLTLNAQTGQISGTPAGSHADMSYNIALSVTDGTATATLPAFTLKVEYNGAEPVVTPPADITINATGLYTPIHLRQLLSLPIGTGPAEVQDVVAELASDNVGGVGCCVTQPLGLLDNVILLPPGRHEIVWRATNPDGLTGEAIQVVNVRPRVSFGKDQVAVDGNNVQVRVILNGPSPFYPLEIPYAIDPASTAVAGLDHDALDGSVIFTSGQTEVSFSVNLLAGGTAVDSQLIFRLDDNSPRSNEPIPGFDAANPDVYDINASATDSHTISIVEGNVAPRVDLVMNQAGTNTILVAQGSGPVTVTAVVRDPNSGDTHSFDWSSTDSRLIDTDGSATDSTFVFDPAGQAGLRRLEVVTTDSAGGVDTSYLHFRIVASLPVLSAGIDTDEDGIDDLTEGLGDENGNGIPDYLDNMPSSNVLPQVIISLKSYLIECDPGVLCSIGQFALSGASGGAQILNDELGVTEGLTADESFEPVGGIFDFAIRDLPIAGQGVRVAIPQQAPIPANAVYRKFIDGKWVDFVENADNALHSAPGNPGYCPPPGDEAWMPGLVQGFLCVQLTIQDGGPNDADGMVNSAIADPGAVSAVKPPPATTPINTKGKGGGALDWSWLLLLGALLVLRHPYAKKSAVLILVVALFSSAAQAAERDARQHYLRINLYQAQGTQGADDFTRALAGDGVPVTLRDYDVSRLAYRMSWGMQWTESTAIELGYLDLGTVTVNLDTTASMATLSESLEAHYPVSADGLTLSHRFGHQFNHHLSLSGEVGLFFWDGKIAVAGDVLDVDVGSGVDPLLGVQLDYQLSKPLSIGLGYNRIFFDGQAVELWGVSGTWTF